MLRPEPVQRLRVRGPMEERWKCIPRIDDNFLYDSASSLDLDTSAAMELFGYSEKDAHSDLYVCYASGKCALIEIGSEKDIATAIKQLKSTARRIEALNWKLDYMAIVADKIGRKSSRLYGVNNGVLFNKITGKSGPIKIRFRDTELKVHYYYKHNVVKERNKNVGMRPLY